MSIELTDAAPVARAEEILTPEALAFVEQLHQRFAARRDELLEARVWKRDEAAADKSLDFLVETKDVREGDWQVAPAPAALQDRRVEMTGPASPANMAINAFNSGAKVWLADLEDASCPSWPNVIDALLNLRDGARGTLAYTRVGADGQAGKEYKLRTDAPLAVVVARPRGWHLPEAHVLIDGKIGVGALVDFGLHFFHLAKLLIDNGAGAVLLPAEDGEPSRGTALERRLHLRRVVRRDRARYDPRHRADRDDPGRLRDGGDPLRVA